MATTTITGLPAKTPAGSQYMPVEDSTSTGKATINDIVAASAKAQAHDTAISELNSKTESIEARFGSFLPTNANIDNLGVDDGGMWLYERVAPRNHTGTFPQTDTYGWLIHIPGTSANFGTQIIRSNNLAASSGMIYIRFRVSGTWSAWMKIVATAI